MHSASRIPPFEREGETGRKASLKTMTDKTAKNGCGISRIQSVPNWEKLIPAFVSVLRNPQTGENDVATITGELVRLAIFADTMSANLTTPPNPSFYATRAAGL